MLEGLRYTCDELLVLRTRLQKEKDHKVKVKYDPMDLGSIYIYDPYETRYIRVPSLDLEYTSGLPKWKHMSLQVQLRAESKKVNIESLALARRQRQALVESSLAQKRRATRSRVVNQEVDMIQPGHESAKRANALVVRYLRFVELYEDIRFRCVPADSFYGRMGSVSADLFQDDDLKALFCADNGRPSLPPSLLSGVLLLQFHDDVSDAEAVERCKYDSRWKVALDLPLDFAGFDPSSLSYFRSRLTQHHQERYAFDRLVKVGRAAGFIPDRVTLLTDTTWARMR